MIYFCLTLYDERGKIIKGKKYDFNEYIVHSNDKGQSISVTHAESFSFDEEVSNFFRSIFIYSFLVLVQKATTKKSRSPVFVYIVYQCVSAINSPGNCMN